MDGIGGCNGVVECGARGWGRGVLASVYEA